MKGGKRKSAGRKPLYNEPTKTIAFRVPISFIEELKTYVRTRLEDYKL